MRILTLCALALVASVLGATETSAARSYPVRAVRIIVPLNQDGAGNVRLGQANFGELFGSANKDQDWIEFPIVQTDCLPRRYATAKCAHLR